MEPKLLTRDEFRAAVFARDGGCVVCEGEGQDAHHIMERRLWPDGGYYLDNGATLCGPCHIKAERTDISCELIRHYARINRVLLPPHLYSDQLYDKWGNPILQNGVRLRGELADDESVKKILSHIQFASEIKYPRTYHLPWSPGLTNDDRVMPYTRRLEDGSVIVTEKMDGENTTMYSDFIHARSIDSGNHPSRDRVKAIWGKIKHDIPQGWRLCGENLYAKHSIAYENLPGYFLLFSVWNEKNVCLSWDETLEWAELLGLPTVTPFFRGVFGKEVVQNAWKAFTAGRESEGYVVRRTDSFHYSEFREMVGKYVRKGHVHTHGHWMRQQVVPNRLRET